MMTVHVLHAGDGYTYLTRQVANGDVKLAQGESLSDYYLQAGNPPGEWIGDGRAQLETYGQVSEAQMKALFGEGRHPDSDNIGAAMAADGASPDAIMEATRLGRRFPRIEDKQADEFQTALRAATTEFRAVNGRPPRAGAEHDALRRQVAAAVMSASGVMEPSSSQVERWLASHGQTQRQPVAGYDLVFSPTKSVSVLWGLGDDNVRKEVEAAHKAAWQETFDWLQAEAALTRVGAAGVAQVETRGLIAAAFNHHDSRTGDPDLHTHVAVSTKVQTRDGKWLSLDGRVLHALGVAASERYNTTIEHELRERLGVRFIDEDRNGKRPVREIEGIAKPVRDAFSSRRAAVASEYERLLAEYRQRHGHEPPRPVQFALAQRATLATRDRKDSIVPLATRRTQWRTAAVAMLGSERAVDAMIGSALHRPAPERSAPVDVDALASTVITNLADQRSWWSIGHVIAEAQRTIRDAVQGSEQDPRAVVDAVVTAAIARSLPLTPPDQSRAPASLLRDDSTSVYTAHGTAKYTAVTVLDAEFRLTRAATTAGGMTVLPETLAAATVAVEESTGRRLDPGQRALAERFARGGHLVEAGIGPAGTGKTSSMQVFAEAVKLAGGRVIGLAPSAAAAAVLSTELGVPADTLAKILHAHAVAASEDEVLAPALRLDASTILLVDEAGMASTGDLDKLLRLARSKGASIRLLGDPSQLASIQAGGVLRAIDDQVGAAHLDVVHRFADPLEAEASKRLRAGHVDALDFYVDHARVTGGSREALLEEIYANWWADQQRGATSVMIAASNADVGSLNARARLERVLCGQVVAEGIALHDGNVAGCGDLIVTRENNRQLVVENRAGWVKNGDTWVVTAVGKDGSLRVRSTTHGGLLTLPGEYVGEKVDLAYASTIWRAQGRTVDTSHFLVDPSMTREQLYVAATRGRDSNRFYAITDTMVDVERHHRPESVRAIREVLDAVLKRAEEIDSALVMMNAEADRAVSLATLAPAYRDAYARVLDPGRDTRITEAVTAALGSEMAATILGEDAWPALRERLAEHELAGADVEALVAAAVASRPLDGARSVSQVLHHRVGPAAPETPSALPAWLPLPPSTSPAIQAALGASPTADAPTAAAAPPVQSAPAGDVDPDVLARVLRMNEVAWQWWSGKVGTPGDWTTGYLESRGLPMTAGWAPNGWDGLVTELRAHGWTDDEICEAGLATTSKRGTIIDRFRDRLMVPIADQNGNILAFTARRSPDETRPEVPKYINSPTTPAYHKTDVMFGLDPDAVARLRAGARPVLLEGAMDVAAMRVAMPDVVPVASCGTAVTIEQLALLRSLTPDGLGSLVVALDPDAAGRKASARVWGMLTPDEAAAARALALPDGLDPADLVKSGRTSEIVAAFESTRSLTRTLVDSILDNMPTDWIEQRVAAVRTVAAEVAHLAPVDLADVNAHLAGRMGDGLSSDTILDILIEAHYAARAEPAHESAQLPASVPQNTRTPFAPDPQVAAWLDQQAIAISSRLDELVARVADGLEPWAAGIPARPTDPAAARAWSERVRQIVAYRDQWSIPSDARLPESRGVGDHARAHDAATTALKELAGIGVDGAQPVRSVEELRAQHRAATENRLSQVLGTSTAGTSIDDALRELKDRMLGTSSTPNDDEGDATTTIKGPQL